MKARDLLIGVPAALLILAVVVLFIDGSSAHPHYVLEQATIVSVGPDARGLGGYPGETERTLVKFSDGMTQFMNGRRGEPGDRIATYRQRGIDSAFGIFSSRE